MLRKQHLFFFFFKS